MSHRLIASGQLERSRLLVVILNILVKLKVFYGRDYLRRFPVLRRSLGKLQSTQSQVILRSFNILLQSIYCIYGHFVIFYAKHCLRKLWVERRCNNNRQENNSIFYLPKSPIENRSLCSKIELQSYSILQHFLPY